MSVIFHNCCSLRGCYYWWDEALPPLSFFDFNYWIPTFENASSLAVFWQEKRAFKKKKSSVWTGQYILGIREWPIYVHDCFLVEIRCHGHQGIPDMCSWLVKNIVGEITLISDFNIASDRKPPFLIDWEINVFIFFV